MKVRPEETSAARELLGYLNLSSGRPDSAFQRQLNEWQRRNPTQTWQDLRQTLLELLEQFHAEQLPGFIDIHQARSVLLLTFDHVFPAYRTHHADLLLHLEAKEFEQPLFLARLLEAVLEQGGPWEETERIIRGALQKLNDFLGYRPIAVLENGRRMEPYDHERFRPIPLYIRGVGTGAGPYGAVIQQALELLKAVPSHILTDAYFDLNLLDELALDPRAHDHLHPANKRTNYLFGEWDPHLIDLSGRYRRFIVRKIILDALLEWMREQRRIPAEEVLYDAGAVLCGTILMASSISGSGPDSHDSHVSLAGLLPKVARQRDEFYAQLLQSASGARAKRLQKHAKSTHQPFGHVRQHLNMYLAQYGQQQVQRRHLAYLYARIGYADAARQQAAVIPSTSARFECEIHWRLTALHRHLDRGELQPAEQLLIEVEEFLKRGVHCGAIVDPWNILGFQGQFPLFAAREDSVPDQRIEILLHLMEALFDSYAILLQDASARGEQELARRVAHRFEKATDRWDRYGTTVVNDLPRVSGKESYVSGSHVAKALTEWRAAGEAAGDISFWRQHVESFHSPKAYAQVVHALLERKDAIAAMGLLMQWLSQAEDVGLESGPHSFFELIVHWLDVAIEHVAPPQRWVLVRRLFDYLEANAGELWIVPQFTEAMGLATAARNSLDEEREKELGDSAGDEDDRDEESSLFESAYEDVVFRDSADDGTQGDLSDGNALRVDPTELELVEKFLDPRLKFLRTLVQLWQVAAAEYAKYQATPPAEEPASTTTETEAAAKPAKSNPPAITPAITIDADHWEQWWRRSIHLRRDLLKLTDEISAHRLVEPSGDHDSNIEFDMQLQTKYYLLQNLISTIASCRSAEWCLACQLPAKTVEAELADHEKHIVKVYRGILRLDVADLRKTLPPLLRALQKQPLLYVPLDHGGLPPQMLAARTLQSVIRFLLSHLPKLGLLRETWHLLQTAQQMERAGRPRGMAVTEFDRLFRIALRNTLETAVSASERWRSGRFSDEELIEVIGAIVEFHLDLWLDHSSTMRLSSIEGLKVDERWESLRDFVKKYGADLFHARMLTLGNVRATLHNGVDKFLAFLDETEDPLHPIQLLEDLRNGKIDRDEAVDHLELIYQMVVDRFDRFIEYNTTTTQSDYGQMFYCLLDFLRVEVSYDRDQWNLMPVTIAHEVLARSKQPEAARIWEEVFGMKTEEMSDKHLQDLAKLEKKYGMRLPSVTSHLQERFVKPLAVNKMLALIPQAVENARAEGTPKSKAFESLSVLVEDYIRDTAGSGLDVPAWLRQLEEELNEGPSSGAWTRGDCEPELQLPAPNLTLREMKSQLRNWQTPLTQKKTKP